MVFIIRGTILTSVTKLIFCYIFFFLKIFIKSVLKFRDNQLIICYKTKIHPIFEAVWIFRTLPV